ncbi:MAG: carboxypeptidase regulatory-like domain-containing protein [Saprospiraceae bacterium]|nr:carboxypeptidase regulatory-like domain-containing protein [Saprospiraceae bacterium]
MKKKATFSCTQQELYLAANLAWSLFGKHRERFAKLKGFYTEGFIADRLAEVAAAKAIPNFKVRKDEPSTYRVYLDEAIEDCAHYFLMLRVLIDSAFRQELLEAKYDAAGLSYFAKAVQGNEAAMNDLNDSAIQFIVKNEADLKANNNMQAGFLAEYQAVVTNYEVQRKAYNESATMATTLTQDNTEANNNVHKAMMTMFADARVIFRKEPELRDKFTFAYVLEQVVSASVAGIRGKVKFEGLKKPFPAVKVAVEGTDKLVESDSLGRYEIPQLANGTYALIFTCKGYKDVFIEEFEVKTGVYNTLNVAMEAVVSEVVI